MLDPKSNFLHAVVLLAFVSIPAEILLGQGIFRGALHEFPLPDPDTNIVLGRVGGTEFPATTEPGVQIRLPATVTYQVTVICEYNQRIARDSAVRIFGQIGKQGSSPKNIPVLPPGGLFLMAVRSMNEPNRFEYAGEAYLPIGVRVPRMVQDPKDVPLIESAMLKLGEVGRTRDMMLTRGQSQELFQREDNYYLWALGAKGLAAYNDKEAADELYNRWINDPRLLSPRQVVWLDYCFQFGMSDEVKPTREARHEMLLNYLRRLPDRMPTTFPAGRDN